MTEALRRALRKLEARVANSVARALVQRVDDSGTRQRLQMGVLAGETIDDAEHYQPYGFSSVPLAGAEGVALFPGGDRGHPLCVVVDDRRHRPKGGKPGEVRCYHKDGAMVTLLDGGDVEIRPAPGGEVYVREEGGAAEPLVRKSEHDSHTHPTGVGPSGTPTVPATGTPVLRG